ncbi:MAG: hypothetical protein ACJ746_25435 [Bryobacteraceae bacterium]
MDAIQKRRWQVALFAMEIALLTGWAFFTGMIYNTSRREYLASTFVLGAGFMVRLVWQRSRIL